MTTRKKWLALAGVAVASTTVLAACGGNSAAKKDAGTTLSYVYATDPDTLDYLVSARNTTNEIITQGVDGLLENDKYGNLIPSLAEDWTVSADGLTYTYKLRKGVHWYTADGQKYAEVTAHDFVSGLKHAADKESELLYVVQDSVVGLDAYVKGETKDFETVGVKALDDYTVQYTLNQPESFWNSKTTYGILFPVNADFVKAQGDKFGAPDPSGILYNGAYFLSSYTNKSSIVFEKNPNYWDKENVKIDTVKLTFFDGQDPESLYKNFAKGAYTQARIFPNTPSYKTAKEKYGDNIVYGTQDATTYYATFNLNRSAYEFTAKDDAQKADTKKAILNKDFRQALTFAFDRSAYNAQSAGEEAATKSLRNMLVPPSFVQANGKTFGDMVTANLASLSEWSDVKLDDAQDGLYNTEKAKAEFAKAKAALEAEGVKFPIHIDITADEADTVGVQSVSSLKESIEKTLGSENVVIDIQQMNKDNYLRTGFMAESAAQEDWDLSVTSGWGPDYQDPSTYLDIFRPTNGANLKVIGLDAGANADIAAQVGLDKYEAMLDEANAITNDTAARYEGYAKAQAYLTDLSVFIPIRSKGGTPTLTMTKPFTAAFSDIGIKGSTSYKYLEMQDKPRTTKEHEAALAKWLEEKAKSNAEYEASLADHVEK